MGLLKNKNSAVMVLNGERLAVVIGQEARIDFTNSADITWSDQVKAREDLIKLVPASRRKNIVELCVVLPRLMFFSKQLRFPSDDQDELRKMIALQISQHVPYPIEQAVWDIVINAQRSAAGTDIVLLALQLERVMKPLRILSAAGFTPTSVTVSSSAVAALLGSAESRSVQVLLITQADNSELCFCVDGDFYFSRGMAYGFKDFSSARLQEFFIQVRLTFESHRKSFPSSTVAGGFYIRGLKDLYPNHFFETLTEVSGLSWNELPLSHKANPRADQDHDAATDLLLGAALLLRGFEKIANFLPPEYRARNTIRILRRNMVGIVAMICGVILAMTMVVGAPVLKKWSYARQLDQELQRIENPFQESRKEQALWTALSKNMQARISPLKFIEKLYDSVPSGLVFSRIQINRDHDLRLEGQAVESRIVDDLRDRMISAGFFSEVLLERKTSNPGPLGEMISFVISAKLFDNPKIEESD